MSFRISTSLDTETIRIILDPEFKERFKNNSEIVRYDGILTLASLRANIYEYNKRIREDNVNAGTLHNTYKRSLAFIYQLEQRGIKIEKSSKPTNPQNCEDVTNTDIAMRVFQDLFGVIEHLDILKRNQELNKQISSMKVRLSDNYIGYTTKNVGKTENTIITNNNGRLKSIGIYLTTLKKLHKDNPSNPELELLVLDTNQIYQSLRETNSPSLFCISLMKEELRQFKFKITKLQNLPEPNELW
jgi:hypothetical protein